MNALRIGSLCSGYGGLDMAARNVLGGELVWVADNDHGAVTILAHHHPTVPNLGDITWIDWANVPPVDVLTAGFPCQPVSNAGRRLGELDDRWLWPDVARAVRVVRPRLVFLENVAALIVRGFDRVLADLAALGYVGSWLSLRASDIGAPHRRERIFIAAWPADTPGPGLETRWQGRAGDSPVADAPYDRQQRVRAARPVRPGPADRSDPAADTNGDAVRQQPVRVPWRGGATITGLPGIWGPYAAAIARWEHILGRHAPEPTELGRTGRPRLAAAFVEWLMGLPTGHVTGVPGLTRTQMLHALGNGVIPAQGDAALRVLLPRQAETTHHERSLEEVTP